MKSADLEIPYKLILHAFIRCYPLKPTGSVLLNQQTSFAQKKWITRCVTSQKTKHAKKREFASVNPQ